MADEMTCGKGLAAKSKLPERLAELTAAMAEVLTLHRKSLGDDDRSRPEHDAYATLTHELRHIAAALAMTADRMAGYEDLPMAEHDVAALTSAEAIDAFERFVRAEREVRDLLKTALEQDEPMLAAMREGAPAASRRP